MYRFFLTVVVLGFAGTVSYALIAGSFATDSVPLQVMAVSTVCGPILAMLVGMCMIMYGIEPKKYWGIPLLLLFTGGWGVNLASFVAFFLQLRGPVDMPSVVGGVVAAGMMLTLFLGGIWLVWITINGEE